MTKEKKYRKRTSFLPTVMSIGVVLFLTGLLGLIYQFSHQMDDYFRENFEIRVFLQQGTEEKDGIDFSMRLKDMKEVKSAVFVSKDEAAQQEMEEQGINFIESLGYNPLPHAIFIKLNSDYTNKDYVDKFVSKIKKNKIVESVNFPENILSMVNENLKTIEIVLLVLVSVFFLAALFVINNTIRLNIFARRFLIKSMQFVGATDGFIIKPFLKMYLIQGIIGALFAIALNASILYWINQTFEGLLQFKDPIPYVVIAGALILLSIIIILPATYFACRKYLRLDINKLY
ncbi:MAG: permease-like cell division protein FtsX [Bacteroidetes bacterium]|nr:permease-like cell division protein FtsX [Bacteroidota bacterium]